MQRAFPLRRLAGVLAIAAAGALGGCVAYPAPYGYGYGGYPAYYAPAPVVGFNFGYGDGYRGHWWR